MGRAPTRLGAPEASRAVLLGIDDYTESPDLDSLPAVVDNVDRLAELLTAPELWGLPPENCTVLHNPLDPLTFCAVPVLMLLLALVAAWVPARRAASIDPMLALRSE